MPSIPMSNQELCGECKRGGLNLLVCDDGEMKKDGSGPSSSR